MLRTFRMVGISAVVILALAMTAMSRAPAVDLSCMGVQTASAAVRINALGSAGDAYKPVLEQVREIQKKATDRIKRIEDDWKKTVGDFRDAHPSVSDTEAMGQIRQSAEMDNKLAKLAHAQYEVHVAEANQIVKVREIPLPNNQQHVDALA